MSVKGNQNSATYKKQIALDLLQRMPKATTNALARILLKENPLDFNTFEATRAIIRRYRGETTNSSKVSQAGVRTKEEKEEVMKHQFSLPESDYEATQPFIIPKGQNNILVLSDIHIPYQDNKALELALQYGLDNNVNCIYLNGDTIDMYQGSRFIKDRRLRDLAGELELTRHFLLMLQTTFKCPIYFKIGNHCDRWENYLRLKAPELLGIDDFKLEQILRLREYGATLIGNKQVTYAGKLAIMHGHEWFAGFAPPVNPARGLYLKAKQSCIIGHHHRSSEHSEKNLGGEVTTTWSTGCLCGLEPEYMPFNNWNHGFAHILVNKDGTYHVNNIRIINGKIV